METAPGPERAAPGSRYSLAMAIKVVLDKYLDHIPLERQVRIMGRHGLVVTSQTLWEMARTVAKRLQALDAALVAYVMAQPVIGLDQTSWKRPCLHALLLPSLLALLPASTSTSTSISNPSSTTGPELRPRPRGRAASRPL